MRLRVKTLAGAVHSVEVTEADDIAALRDRVASVTGFGQEGLRLLHAGELLVAGPIRHTRLLDGDFIVAVVAKQTKPKAQASPADVKMAEANPAPKDKKEEKEKDKLSLSRSDVDMKPAAVVSSPEPPPPVEAPGAAEQLRVQLQDLMMGLLDLAGGARQNNNNPPPAAPAQAPAEVVVDPALIQQLVDMGFAQNRSRKALILSRLNLQRAMEWLLEHENDPDIDAPLPPGAAMPKAPAGPESDAQAVQRLQEMGFSAEDVQQALRATNFNYEAACAWLLGDRDGAAAAAAGEDQGDEEEEEVDDSNPMIAAILNNPQIQSSLTPRVVQAFQAMMENPGSTGEYINDPEVGPVILQVLQIVRGGNAPAGAPAPGSGSGSAPASPQPKGPSPPGGGGNV